MSLMSQTPMFSHISSSNHQRSILPLAFGGKKRGYSDCEDGYDGYDTNKRLRELDAGIRDTQNQQLAVAHVREDNNNDINKTPSPSEPSLLSSDAEKLNSREEETADVIAEHESSDGDEEAKEYMIDEYDVTPLIKRPFEIQRYVHYDIVISKANAAPISKEKSGENGDPSPVSYPLLLSKEKRLQVHDMLTKAAFLMDDGKSEEDREYLEAVADSYITEDIFDADDNYVNEFNKEQDRLLENYLTYKDEINYDIFDDSDY
ncbi:hypothetical protein BGZ49_000117 [Haplosporangium sp. Z 27]|nr:hypothetical protein BGZ49_000117 [Haplosporangium sp. Z 27]